MSISVTSLCNMALARIGSKRINDYETDTLPEAIWCRVHYEQTRDSLLRSHNWNFATARATLAEDTASPAFKWTNQFILPADFLRLVSMDEFDDANWTTDEMHERFTIEGERLLTNETSANIVYIKQVTDPAQFDTLFVECLVLSLALKLTNAIAGTNTTLLKKEIKEDLFMALSKARVVNRQENNAGGRWDFRLSRYIE